MSRNDINLPTTFAENFHPIHVRTWFGGTILLNVLAIIFGFYDHNDQWPITLGLTLVLGWITGLPFTAWSQVMWEMGYEKARQEMNEHFRNEN
jgi:hypothetical protein